MSSYIISWVFSYLLAFAFVYITQEIVLLLKLITGGIMKNHIFLDLCTGFCLVQIIFTDNSSFPLFTPPGFLHVCGFTYLLQHTLMNLTYTFIVLTFLRSITQRINPSWISPTSDFSALNLTN